MITGYQRVQECPAAELWNIPLTFKQLEIISKVFMQQRKGELLRFIINGLLNKFENKIFKKFIIIIN